MPLTKDQLNSLIVDIVELVIQRTNIDEYQADELFLELEYVLDEFFDYPDYSNYN